MSLKHTSLLPLGALLLAPCGVSAQGVYGGLFGTVTDATGAVVPNATVTITDTDKGTTRTLQTNAAGEYSATRLVPDTYSVKAASGSFAPAEVPGIVVAVNNSPEVNLTLAAAGAEATNVTVTSAAPALKTDQADVSQTLDNRQLQSIPSVNRNFTQFVLLTPG